MKEVKIQIPDNCELIKDGDTYIVREKKQGPPRSWEEFCEKIPISTKECYITTNSTVIENNEQRKRALYMDRCYCTSAKEAAAFLALMQLRQLRKAWVGDWEQTSDSDIGYVLYDIKANRLITGFGKFYCFITLSFPTKEMAENFLNCFRDLCEIAKILL